MRARRPLFRSLRVGIRVGIALAVLSGAVTLPASPLRAQGRIAIEIGWLDPPVLTAGVGERVTFVNQSGRPVHVELLGESGRHHIVQVRTETWAAFHTIGRHPYVVHFPESGAADLWGEVTITGDSRETLDLPRCSGVTIMGVCLER